MAHQFGESQTECIDKVIKMDRRWIPFLGKHVITNP